MQRASLLINQAPTPTVAVLGQWIQWRIRHEHDFEELGLAQSV